MGKAIARPPALRAGTDPERPLDATRLLSVRGDTIAHRRIGALLVELAPGDLLVQRRRDPAREPVRRASR